MSEHNIPFDVVKKDLELISVFSISRSRSNDDFLLSDSPITVYERLVGEVERSREWYSDDNINQEMETLEEIAFILYENIKRNLEIEIESRKKILSDWSWYDRIFAASIYNISKRHLQEAEDNLESINIANLLSRFDVITASHIKIDNGYFPKNTPLFSVKVSGFDITIEESPIKRILINGSYNEIKNVLYYTKQHHFIINADFDDEKPYIKPAKGNDNDNDKLYFSEKSAIKAKDQLIDDFNNRNKKSGT